MMKKIIVSILLVILTTFNAISQGYNIEVNINGVRDSLLLLAMHYGNNKYVRDSAYLNNKGKAVFKSDKPLEGGMYIIAMNGTQLFDFLISDDNQTFKINTKKNDYVNALHFVNSSENEGFADFNRFMIQQQKEEETLKKFLANKTDSKSLEDSIVQIDKDIRKRYHEYVEQIAEKYPNTLLLNLTKALDKVPTPDFNIDKSNLKYDSIFTMQYYLYTKDHFFDNYNFKDKRLLNTPIFIPTIDYYFDNVILQTPDSIIPVVDIVIKKTNNELIMRDFMIRYLLNKYLQSDIMGMESVAVHIIDNYYVPEKMDIKDSVNGYKIRQFADQNRITLIGKQAYDLKMQSPSGQYESLYSIDAPYTLVYFYEPSCGHCKRDTPKFYNVYKKYRDKGLQAFAVYTQQDKEEWLSYVTSNELDWINVWDPKNENDFRYKYSIYIIPQAYLLDKNKKIIARRINAESLDKLLNNLLNK